MEECLVDSGAADVCPAPQEGGVVLMLTIKTVLSEILQIETPPLKVRSNASVSKYRFNTAFQKNRTGQYSHGSLLS